MKLPDRAAFADYPERLAVTILADDIESGEQRKSNDCAGAKSIRRDFPEFGWVAVGTSAALQLSREITGGAVDYTLFPVFAAQAWLKAFDRDKSLVEPAKFTAVRNDLLTMQQRLGQEPLDGEELEPMPPPQTRPELTYYAAPEMLHGPRVLFGGYATRCTHVIRLEP